MASGKQVESPFPSYDPEQRYIDYLSERWNDRNTGGDGPTVVSTFAGTGGSSLGYQMAGFKELLAVEWDDHAVKNFSNNFGHVDVYHGDIADLTVNEAKSRTGLSEGELDLFDGSPPCQGFSIVGNRNVGDDRNQLFREYARLLRGLRPKTFVMENVKGMVQGDMKAVFKQILQTLSDCGYRVSARLLNAKYLNVPQTRPRLIFVGVREDLQRHPHHPKPTPPLINIRTAIEGIDPVEYVSYSEGSREWKEWNVVKPGTRLEDYSLSFSKKGSGFSTDKPAPDSQMRTLTKTFRKTGKMYWGSPRSYSIKEAQVLQSFPLEFALSGSMKDKWARIGNSVPPIMMGHVAATIKEYILDEIADE